MDVKSKTALEIALNNLKRVAQQENMIFGIVVNAENYQESKLCFLEKSDLSVGMMVGLDELNRED